MYEANKCPCCTFNNNRLVLHTAININFLVSIFYVFRKNVLGSTVFVDIYNYITVAHTAHILCNNTYQ